MGFKGATIRQAPNMN